MPAYNPPPQVLFSPVSNYYQGKAIRTQQAMAEKQLEMVDKNYDLNKRQVEVQEGRLEFDAEKLYAASMAKLGEERTKALGDAASEFAYSIDNGVDLEVAQEKYQGDLVGIFGQEQAEKMFTEKYDRDGDGMLNEQEVEMIRSFATVHGYDPKDAAGSTTVLSLQEKIDMGMAPDWAKASVVERDETGNISVTSQPTGMTETDAQSRGLTPSQAGSNIVDFQDNTIGAVGAVQLGTELLKTSASNPESIGVPGGIMRFGSNLVSGAKAIADWAGYEQIAPEDQEKQNLGASAFDYESIDEDKLGVSGAEAEKFRAGIYGIAFAAAVAEQGTRPTDKDIQQFIDQIGGRATSARSFRETIFQFMRRQDRRLNTIADVKQIPDDKRAAAFSAWTPAYQEFVETYAKSAKLKTATDPNTGQRFIELSPDNWEEF